MKFKRAYFGISLNLHVPYATTVDGEVIYQDVQTSLKQTSKEKNIGLYYASDGQEDTDWKTSFSIEYRQNAAGEEGRNQFVPGIQISKKFWGSCKFLWWENEKEFCKKLKEKELARKQSEEAFKKIYNEKDFKVYDFQNR